MKKTLATIMVLMLTIALMTACKSSDVTTSPSQDKQVTGNQQENSVTDDQSDVDQSSTSASKDQATTSDNQDQVSSESKTGSTDTTNNKNQASGRSLEMLGSSADGVYTNDYFGFSLQYPSDWYVMSDVELIQAMVAGLQANNMTVDNFDLNQVEALMVFGTTEEDFNSPSKTFISNLVINAEEQFGLNASITPYEYAKIAIDQLKGYGYEISDIDDLVIDGKDFSSFEVSLTSNDMTIAQRYYFVKLDSYMFNFVFSYNEESKDFVLSIADTITFSK